jgi:hypothetical protein
MPTHPRLRVRHSFIAKVILGFGLVALTDFLVYGHGVGSTLGGLVLALLAAAVATGTIRLGDRRAAVAALIAALLGCALLERPTFFCLVLFGCALSVAVLSARAKAGDDAFRWFQRLAFNGLAATIRIPADALRLARVSPFGRKGVARLLVTLVLPLLGGAVFLWLFALANPVIEKAFRSLFALDLELDVPRVILWGFVSIVVCGFLRPRLLRRTLKTPGCEGDLEVPGVNVASITLALIVFNAVFALQNGLDIAFLWSGAGLPDGMTLAQYAHRGAYPLIATALLAGLFVLVALAPGSASSRNRTIRWLVILWVAQNLLLVASTALRTIDYVEVYSLTRLRIAALAWMGLVALGLVLICWRMLRGKSASWLINANVLAAGAVICACSIADLGSLAAAWNVRHAAEAGGQGAPLDLRYLEQLGESALVPVVRMERRNLPPGFRSRLACVRDTLTLNAEIKQSDWRLWTWRGERRLRQAVRTAPSTCGLGLAPAVPAPHAYAPAAQPPLTYSRPR